MALNITRAVPPALTYDALQSLVPSSKSQYRRPNTTGRSIGPLTTGTQEVIFPIQQTANAFLVSGTLAICGSITVAGITAGDNTTGSAVIGSLYSMMQRQVTRSTNGVVIETIDNVGRLIHHLSNNIRDFSQGVAQACMDGSTDMGAKNGGTTASASLSSFGVVFNNTNDTISFCLPIIGCLNTEKMIPLHAHGFEVAITFAPLLDFIYQCAGVANSTATSYTLNNLEVIAEMMVLEDQSMSAILSMYPSINLRSESWTYCAGQQLPASAGAGTYDHPLSMSLQGLKRILWTVAPSNAVDKGFAGVNPNLQNWNFLVGSKSFPVQPIDATRLAYNYMEAQKASGSLYNADHCGNVTRATYGVASTAYQGAKGEWSAYYDTAVAYTKSTLLANAIIGNKYSGFLDLETLPQSHYMFSGVKSTGGQSLLRMQIASQLANVTHQTHIWANYDMIVTFNMQDGSVVVTN